MVADVALFDDDVDRRFAVGSRRVDVDVGHGQQLLEGLDWVRFCVLGFKLSILSFFYWQRS